MRLELSNVVHIGLPVLDVALVVTGHHPVVVVRPHHRTNRAIVSLQKNAKTMNVIFKLNKNLHTLPEELFQS